MSKPVVLCFSGHDPSGGAGIQADIETLQAHHCHALTMVTCMTEQDSSTVYRVLPNDAESLYRQTQRLVDDIQIDAIKTGLMGSVEIIDLVSDIASQLSVPLVIDPVLAAGNGRVLSTEETTQAIIDAYIEGLIPQASIVLPNIPELEKLSKGKVEKLLATGVKTIGVTGTHDDTTDVINTLYSEKGVESQLSWPRLPGSFHGTGCTLASAVVAELVHGSSEKEAFERAQFYTYETISQAHRPGEGQSFPDRVVYCGNIKQ